MSAPLLEVEDLTVEFATPGGIVRAVDGVSFTLGHGEVLGLVGESGSGKTVTCRALMRLLPSRQARIVAGRAQVEGTDLLALDEAEMTRVRGATIGMIFQNPMTHLDPVMTIGDQIAEPLRVHHGMSRNQALGHAIDLLRQVGIPDPKIRIRSYPHEFSGGMRQRAMIAAALACQPKVLIADEPTTALDVTVQAQIMELLSDLQDERKMGLILITHDLGVVAEVADRVAVMYAGRIVEQADVYDLYAQRTLLRRPLHPYPTGLIGSQPGATEPHRPLPSIPGQPPSLADPPAGCRFHPRCTHAEAACRIERPPLVEPDPGHATACRRWRFLRDAA